MTATTARSRKFPTSLNGGELQDADDVRVGETHLNAPEGFERSTPTDVDATDAGPDSELDSGERGDDRLEQRDDATDERTPSSADSADAARTRGNERAR